MVRGWTKVDVSSRCFAGKVAGAASGKIGLHILIAG